MAINTTWVDIPSQTIGATDLFFQTTGRQHAGDSGDAFYQRIDVGPSGTYDSTEFVRSADRWNRHGVSDPTNGGWWSLVRKYQIDVRWFGAVCNGSVDDTLAIQQAIDYLGHRIVTEEGNSIGNTAQLGVIYIPGTCRITSTLLVNRGLISIRGDAARGSAIIADIHADFGDLIEVGTATPETDLLPGFSLSDITLRHYNPNVTGGSCLHLVRCINVYVTNVLFQNHFGGLLIEGGATHTYTNFQQRTGQGWSGSKAGSYMCKIMPGASTWNGGKIPNEIFISNFNWDADALADTNIGLCDHGLHYGSGDGVFLDNGHIFGNSGADCWIEPATATTQCDGLRCSNVWFDNFSANGVVITGSVTNNAGTPFGDFQFTGCKFLGSNQNNYNFHVVGADCNVQSVSITGCHFDKAGLSNIRIEGVGNNFNITGGDIAMAGVKADASDRFGVYISGSPTNITISGITFGGDVQGTATQAAGVNVTGGDFITVGPCTYRGGTASIADSSTTKHKVYSEPTETETFWQNIFQSMNILQLKAAGSYFELNSGANLVNDLTCRWNKRVVTIAPTSNVTFKNIAGQLQLTGSVDFLSKSGDLLTLLYTGSYWRELSRSVA